MGNVQEQQERLSRGCLGRSHYLPHNIVHVIPGILYPLRVYMSAHLRARLGTAHTPEQVRDILCLVRDLSTTRHSYLPGTRY